jgi:8-oxo-dGTP pyrophosphatase MutT (NUDIX family)
VPRTHEVAIFVTRRGRSEVLVVHRSPAGGGYWHTIAGGVEPGETAPEAARRELLEETGLDTDVGLSEVAFDYLLEGRPAMHVDCFLVDAPDDWEPQLDHEHDGYRWHTAEDAPGALFWDDTSAALRQLLHAAP